MVLSRPAKQGLEDALTVRSTNELHKASGECCECERGHLSHGSAQRKVRFLTCISWRSKWPPHPVPVL